MAVARCSAICFKQPIASGERNLLPAVNSFGPKTPGALSKLFRYRAARAQELSGERGDAGH